MWKIGDFRIGAYGKWMVLVTGSGSRIIRKFNVASWTRKEVWAYRAGYVKGLNDAKRS